MDEDRSVVWITLAVVLTVGIILWLVFAGHEEKTATEPVPVPPPVTEPAPVPEPIEPAAPVPSPDQPTVEQPIAPTTPVPDEDTPKPEQLPVVPEEDHGDGESGAPVPIPPDEDNGDHEPLPPAPAQLPAPAPGSSL